MAEVRLRARCFPTEERDRVVGAILNIFPDAAVQGDDPVTAKAHSLEAFSELLRRQRIRDAARSVMLRGVAGDEARFRLNKQAAAVGKVSFSTEQHALGDIEVTIVSDRVVQAVESVTRHEQGSGS